MDEEKSRSEPAASGFGWLGPGLIMAASGIGASDVVSATVGGATYGLGLLWAVGMGAFFKFVLSEGLARWSALAAWPSGASRGVPCRGPGVVSGMRWWHSL